MPAEIYWTPVDEDDLDLLPGEVTRIVRENRELRVFFAGIDATYGTRYEGVLRLALRLGNQRTEGKLTYLVLDEEPEVVPFVVTGAFANRTFEAFTGTWLEQGRSCQVDVVGLPVSHSRTPSRSGRKRYGKT